jgi:hypothetical protein
MTECLRYELQPLNVAVFLGAFGVYTVRLEVADCCRLHQD